MATSDSAREAIFNRLDDLFSGTTGLDSSSTDNASPQQIGTAKTIAGNTTDKAYHRITASINVTSYSKLGNLHSCPRYYELMMLSKTRQTIKESGVSIQLASEPQQNLDFAYGHSVGSGIQTFAATGNLQAAQFAAFIAWRADYDAVKVDARGNDSGKSLTWALYAVEKFAFFWANEMAEWEILLLPNEQAAVELAFAVDTQNGYFHLGHIDAVLRNKLTGRLAVWEGKTTGYESVNAAMYGNSYQALGYGVVVDAIAKQLGLDTPDYEVFYIVYSSKSREFQLLPFMKNKSQRAEWLQDLLLNHAMLDKYQELKFFPKRGDNCINKYGRTCEWYGNCHMRNSSLFPGVEAVKLTKAEAVAEADFVFTLDELLAAQRKST